MRRRRAGYGMPDASARGGSFLAIGRAVTMSNVKLLCGQEWGRLGHHASAGAHPKGAFEEMPFDVQETWQVYQK